MDDERLEDLVERSRKGDLDAFSAVVQRLHGEIRGFAAMSAVGPDWIDDVAQEIFIEIYRALPRYETDRPFLKWIRGVARNVIRRHAERRSRESKLRQDAVSVLVRQRREQFTEEPAGGTFDALRRCLERLPEHLKELLRLRYTDQKTPVEIARGLKRNADAVRMSLMRARGLLSQCIQSQSGASL